MRRRNKERVCTAHRVFVQTSGCTGCGKVGLGLCKIKAIQISSCTTTSHETWLCLHRAVVEV